MRTVSLSAAGLTVVMSLAIAACSGSGSSLAPAVPTAPQAQPPSATDGAGRLFINASSSPLPRESVAPGAGGSPQPVAPPPTAKPIALSDGNVLGADVLSPDGDTASGGQGQTIDGIPCSGNITVLHHPHAHLSLIMNGVRYAVPDTIGIFQPGPEVNGFTNSGTCFYYLHTHDADGKIHVEDPVAGATPTLGNFFDIWGEPLSRANVAGFTGTLLVYIAFPPPKGLTASNFVVFSGDPRSIVLKSHEEIVLEMGPTYVTPPKLQPITFDTEF